MLPRGTLRGYDFTLLKLQQFIDKGFFDATQGKMLKETLKNDQGALNDDKTFKLYKKYCKYDGKVYYSWFSKDKATNDWLKAPEPLFRGRKRQELVWKDNIITQPDLMTGLPVQIKTKQQVLDWVPVFETLYPLHIFRYQQTEESDICETKGRAWLDGPKQEAQTCLYSNFVNSSTRASNVYCAPVNGTGGSPRKLDFVLEPGSVVSEPMQFWNPPMPSFDLIRAAQALDTQTQIETGRVAFAAVNSQDSRKTAKEIGVAEQQNQLLTSVQVTLFSISLCNVWNDVWSIVQSLALQGVIPFLMQGQSTDETGNIIYVNDTKKLSLDYKLTPAGEVDVIERAELQMKREKLWPIITGVPALVQNPLALMFIKDMIEENFPDDSAEYIGMIDQMSQQSNMVQTLLGVLQASAEEKRPVTPEEVQQLMAVTQPQQV